MGASRPHHKACNEAEEAEEEERLAEESAVAPSRVIVTATKGASPVSVTLNVSGTVEMSLPVTTLPVTVSIFAAGEEGGGADEDVNGLAGLVDPARISPNAANTAEDAESLSSSSRGVAGVPVEELTGAGSYL